MTWNNPGHTHVGNGGAIDNYRKDKLQKRIAEFEKSVETSRTETDELERTFRLTQSELQDTKIREKDLERECKDLSTKYTGVEAQLQELLQRPTEEEKIEWLTYEV